MSAEATCVLRAEGIGRSFPGVRALDGAGVCLRGGEVHALMGQNGAGKSTLIKVLTGVCAPDSGRIELDGRSIAPASPLDAQLLGISTVYQEVNLCPELSVAENLFAGRYPRHLWWRGGGIDWAEVHTQAQQLVRGLQLDIDVTRQLSSYSVAIQQMVAIARATSISARVLILDEPTSSLDDEEVQQLFALLDRLRRQGLAILFVTHFLDQVYAIADRITVLRNGTLVGEYLTAQLDRGALIAAMVGREPVAAGAPASSRAPVAARDPASGRTHATAGGAASGGGPVAAGDVPSGRVPVAGGDAGYGRVGVAAGAAASGRVSSGAGWQRVLVLQATGLHRKGQLRSTDITLARGEIVGLAGLLGSGRTELARLLFGLDTADGGDVSVNGHRVVLESPAHAMSYGLAFCPEDRKTEGMFSELSLRENVVLALQARAGILRRIPPREQRELAQRFIDALGIKTSGVDTPVAQLSGGNQQKALLARALATKPTMLILDEPTRGVDVAAREEIMNEIVELARDDMAVLFISAEIEEVTRLADRVVVMRDRRKAGELPGGCDEHAVYAMIAQP
jgi:galactofuranose transport system ATP-binding protein